MNLKSISIDDGKPFYIFTIIACWLLGAHNNNLFFSSLYLCEINSGIKEKNVSNYFGNIFGINTLL